MATRSDESERGRYAHVRHGAAVRVRRRIARNAEPPKRRTARRRKAVGRFGIERLGIERLSVGRFGIERLSVGRFGG